LGIIVEPMDRDLHIEELVDLRVLDKMLGCPRYSEGQQMVLAVAQSRRSTLTLLVGHKSNEGISCAEGLSEQNQEN